MTKQALPAVSEVTKDTLEEFKTADKVVLVAYFAADDKASNETFTSVANGLRDNFLFGATNDAALAKAEGVKQPGLVCTSPSTTARTSSPRPSMRTYPRLRKVASTPLIGEVGPETYAGYMAAGIPLAYIFAETPEEREEFAKELKPLALKHKGEINFATIDAKSFGQHAGNLNLKVGTWPAFAIQRTEKNEKFPTNQEAKITEKEIGKFVDDFLAGKIDPSIKSEPIPESNDGPVTVVVAHNYKDVVIDNDKDVLVEFYAPWCGHCKALAPKYEELGQLYASDELSKLVTIAKVDATLNDVPDEIQGFLPSSLFPLARRMPQSTTLVPHCRGSRPVHRRERLTQASASVGEAVEDATESAKASASSATDSAASAVSEGTETVKSGASVASDSASSAASEATKSVKSAASEVTNSASSAASEASASASSVKDEL
nr:putative protein disulfide isomerase [Alternaria alternata]CAA58999.1 protein disulfide isomerase [Alternaria alternata]